MAAAAARPPSSLSSDLMRLASGCSVPSWSPFCRLVGREAEAEAWAARRWRGLAATVTAGGGVKGKRRQLGEV